MARREWAAKLIADDTFTVFLDRDNVRVVGKNAAEDRLRKEHARAVRIVKADLAEVKRDQHNYSVVTKNELVKRLERLLAALQKGRA